ncbi:MAG: Ig-like domain repeat protein [Casimicrobium sp.]
MQFFRFAFTLAVTLLLAATARDASAVTPKIASGEAHSCALTSAGGIKCWGWDYWGQLGTNNLVTLGPATDVAAGSGHTCALLVGGSVKCWGANYSNQLGDGTILPSQVPVAVVGLSAQAVKVAAGTGHTCALLVSGGLQCWGANAYGQLGDGTTTPGVSPVSVINLPGPVIEVAAGYASTCAIIQGGDVFCWGLATHADGSQTPGLVGETGLQAVKIGHTQGRVCVLTESTAVKCSSVGNPFEVVAGLETGVADLTVGSTHACALMITGAISCWGSGDSGQLGDGSNAYNLPLTVLPSSPAGVVALAAGWAHTCALTVFGSVKCWGDAREGQSGGGGTEVVYSATPGPVLGLAAAAVSVDTREGVSCASLATGAAACWGRNGQGQLGDGTTVNRWTANPVAALAGGLVGLSVGGGHTCGIGNTGTVYCWGSNLVGALGDATTTDRFTPTAIAGAPFVAQEVGTGGYFTCARSASEVYCWGYGSSGQLGNAAYSSSMVPVPVTGTSGTVTSLSVGMTHACAVVNGGVKCWGDNSGGLLGNGTTTATQVPVQPTGLSSGVRKVIVGYWATCAILEAGGAVCWGGNGAGELGTGNNSGALSPVAAPFVPPTVSDIVVMNGKTCALAGGHVTCWGNLGDGTSFANGQPASISGMPTDVVAFGGRGDTLCVVRTGGTVLCRGSNQSGQLGRGVADYRPLPTITVPNLNVWGEMQASVAPGQHLAALPLTLSALLPGPSSTGTVTFSIDGNDAVGCVVVPVTGSSVSCTTSTPAAGNHTVLAMYSGDANHAALNATATFSSTGSAVATIGATNGSLLLRGQSTTLSVTLTGAGAAPSGSVSVSGAGASCSITLSAGAGQCALTPTQLGLDQPLTISYPGDFIYRPGAGSSSVSVVTAFDFDANGSTDAAGDGMLLVRYLLGLRGTALTEGLADPTAKRLTPESIATYLASRPFDWDADLDGRVLPLTDGLLVTRYLLGLRGAALTQGAIGPNAFRTAPANVEAYLHQFDH